jgi:predicted nucleic acid-binding protein
VKLVIEEPESASLERYLRVHGGPLLAISQIAIVEVLRATGIANPAPEVREAAERLLASCMLIDVTDGLLRTAAGLASATVRTLDAIHLASALRVDADELVGYDRRLIAAAAARGLIVSSPAGA